jgi:cation:H+ antiporter
MISHVMWLVLGVILLALGGDSLGRGLAAVLVRLGMGATTAGVCLVSFGGSLPDLAVNVVAVLGGHSALALGNIIGSSIVNIGLVLGVAALTRPLDAALPSARVLFGAMFVAPLALIAMSHNARLGYLDGGVLVLAFVVLAVLIARHRGTRAREDLAEAFAERTRTFPSVALNGLRIVIGVAALGFGARLVVGESVKNADAAGLSELFIGLTVIAFATSVPQIVNGALDALRERGALVLASVSGSNLFNLLFMLGVTALLHPLAMPESLLRLELPALAAFIVALYPMLRGDMRVSRGEGAILLAAFLGLTACQWWWVLR